MSESLTVSRDSAVSANNASVTFALPTARGFLHQTPSVSFTLSAPLSMPDPQHATLECIAHINLPGWPWSLYIECTMVAADIATPSGREKSARSEQADPNGTQAQRQADTSTVWRTLLGAWAESIDSPAAALSLLRGSSWRRFGTATVHPDHGAPTSNRRFVDDVYRDELFDEQTLTRREKGRAHCLAQYACDLLSGAHDGLLLASLVATAAQADLAAAGDPAAQVVDDPQVREWASRRDGLVVVCALRDDLLSWVERYREADPRTAQLARELLARRITSDPQQGLDLAAAVLA